MKLAIEIKDNKVFFEYQIGESKYHSSTHLSADLLCNFTDILKSASQARCREIDESIMDMRVKAYVEKESKK